MPRPTVSVATNSPSNFRIARPASLLKRPVELIVPADIVNVPAPISTSLNKLSVPSVRLTLPPRPKAVGVPANTLPQSVMPPVVP